MAENNKKGLRKVWFIVLGSAALLSMAVILTTCSLFDSQNVNTTTKTDWTQIVKNSKWTFSEKSISDSGKLIVALQTVTSVEFSSDYSMQVNYSDDKGNSYPFSCGTFAFSSENGGSITLTQASAQGSVVNNCQITFSNQSGKSFDDKNYVMTIKADNLGSLYFFSN